MNKTKKVSPAQLSHPTYTDAQILAKEVHELNSELAYALDVARLADLLLNALLLGKAAPEIIRELIVAIETLTIHLRGCKRNGFENEMYHRECYRDSDFGDGSTEATRNFFEPTSYDYRMMRIFLRNLDGAPELLSFVPLQSLGLKDETC